MISESEQQEFKRIAYDLAHDPEFNAPEGAPNPIRAVLVALMIGALTIAGVLICAVLNLAIPAMVVFVAGVLAANRAYTRHNGSPIVK